MAYKTIQGMTVLCLATGLAKAISSSGHTLSPNFQSRLTSADQLQKVDFREEPQVQIQGYLWDITKEFSLLTGESGNSIGITFSLVADLFAKLHAPAFWLTRKDENWMVFNPNLFGEGSITSSMKIKLWFIEVTLQAKALGYKFSPLDFQFSWDLDQKNRYCYSVGYYQNVFDFTLEIETLVNECYFGLVGIFTTTDSSDCAWRRYDPQLPLAKFGLLPTGDQVLDYISWTCNDDSQLQTTDNQRDIDGDGTPDLEPSNNNTGKTWL